MAGTTNKPKVKIEWPKNFTVQGQLSFPLKSDEEIEQLKAWRLEKDIPKPQFDDKIGGTLFLTQAQWDRSLAHLRDVYIPFVDTLYADTNGSKGVDSEYTAMWLKQIADDVWHDPGDKKKKPNLPLRRLSPKDIENLPDENPYVGKLKFAGPYEEDISVKALVRENAADPQSSLMVHSIASIKELGILDEKTDVDRLWFGAGWTFRAPLKFNAYDKASAGITAYISGPLYLMTDHPMPTFSGNTDEEVVEDGDDWE